MTLRSDSEKLKENVLPLNSDIFSRIQYLSKFYSEADKKFLNKPLTFSDLRNKIINDVIKI